MLEHMKKHPTDQTVTLKLNVSSQNAPLIIRYAKAIEQDEDRTYSIAEVFPEYIGSEQKIALRAYRTREDLTQKQLSELTGLSVTHISRIENGKLGLDTNTAKKLADVLNCDYQQLM